MTLEDARSINRTNAALALDIYRAYTALGLSLDTVTLAESVLLTRSYGGV